MLPARLYDSPQAFAEMMARHVGESLDLQVRQHDEDPLLLDICFRPDDEKDRSVVSLHRPFATYMRTGDLNGAIDFLNGIIRGTDDIRKQGSGMLRVDSSCIFPAIRARDYVEQAGSGLLFEECVPGLYVVFLEIAEGYSKLIGRSVLEANPRLTEDKIKRLAYRNLRSEGWWHSGMHLPSPFRESCIIETFMDSPYPAECQFLLPEMTRAYLPSSYLVAFPNRRTTLLMRSKERMETAEQASRLASKSRFLDIVRRSYRVMPQPVSERIYWSSNGVYQELE